MAKKMQTGASLPGHNDLVSLSENQRDPYRVKPTEFSVTDVNSGDGQSGTHGTAEGHNELVMDSVNQCGPRHTEDSGPGEYGAGTPTNWESGGRSAIVAKNFPVGKAPSRGTSLSDPYSVDCTTGKLEGLDEHYYSTSVD